MIGLLDDYQKQAKLNENIQSIEDMQKFLERYERRVFVMYTNVCIYVRVWGGKDWTVCTYTCVCVCVDG